MTPENFFVMHYGGRVRIYHKKYLYLDSGADLKLRLSTSKRFSFMELFRIFQYLGIKKVNLKCCYEISKLSGPKCFGFWQDNANAIKSKVKV